MKNFKDLTRFRDFFLTIASLFDVDMHLGIVQVFRLSRVEEQQFLLDLTEADPLVPRILSFLRSLRL